MGLKFIAILLLVAAAYAEQDDETSLEADEIELPDEVESDEDEEADTEDAEGTELEADDEDAKKKRFRPKSCLKGKKSILLSTSALCYCKLAIKGRKGDEADEADMDKDMFETSLDDAVKVSSELRKKLFKKRIYKLVKPHFKRYISKFDCCCTKVKAVRDLLGFLHMSYVAHGYGTFIYHSTLNHLIYKVKKLKVKG